MATSFKQAVNKNLECPVCLSFFKDPKNLTCSHTFCKGCLETLLKSHWRNKVLLCPTCRGKTSVPGGDVGKLQSNITVRSLVEDVETQSRSNCNQEDKSLQRKGNKCQKHPHYDEECFCLNCNKYVCCKCAILEHAKNDHIITIRPDKELPRRIAEEGKIINFRSLGLDRLQLGQLRQNKSKWILRTEGPLFFAGNVQGMAISPYNEMAIVCGFVRGIEIYSSEGIIKGTVLKSVRVRALHFMPDSGYVIHNIDNRISLYTGLSRKLDVTFETMDAAGSAFRSLTVGKDGLIFIGYNRCKKIQVFKPEGGKAIREIKCFGFEPWQMFAMTSSQAIVVKNKLTEVDVINDVSGAIIHSISKAGENAYPAVCQDNSVIIAWVNEDQGLLSIVKYTKELKYINNILTDFKIMELYDYCYLQEFKTGEIAFCTTDRLYIFQETWE